MLVDLKQCVRDAIEVTSSIEPHDLRTEAFKIILTKLVEINVQLRPNQVPMPNEVRSTNNLTSDSNSDEVPAISPTNSTASNIRLLFSTGWGMKRRSSSEISKALDSNGVPDPKHISTVLSRLVDSKELLRIKQGEVFVFWRNPAYRNLQDQVNE
jgi:hypothetical protein